MSAIFQQAVLESDVTKVKFLVKYTHGIRIDQANKNGLTALQQASLDGNLELVNFLLESGADLSLVDREGMTALHLASHAGHLEVVSLLVNSACANVNAKTDRGQKPIDVAKTDQVRALLSQVMLADNLKQRCNVTPSDHDWDNSGYSAKLTAPGSRYSISSASTDSGVSEDFVLPSPDTYFDTKYSSYSRTGSATSEQNPDQSQVYFNREKNEEERRAISSPVSSRNKSQSFSGKHDYSTIHEASAEETPIRTERTLSNPHERERYRRIHKLGPRDASRRKTVTFGENESRTISYEKFPEQKSFSFRRTPITRPALPSNWTCYGSEQAKTPSVEGVYWNKESITKSEASSTSQVFAHQSENNFPQDSKHRKHVLSGFFTKSMH